MNELVVNRKKLLKNTLVAFAFMSPALILLIIFLFYPIIYSLPLALYDYSVLAETKFIGFANFTRALHDSVFWISLKHSLLFVLVVPPIQILSILLALLVNRPLRGIKFFRVLYYIPVVTSMIAVSIIWGWIFNTDGLINTLLINAGILKNPILFTSDPKLALPSMMFITLWQGLGYYMMLYLAGLQSIPKEFEEAAIIDGAGKFKLFVKIRVPLLKPYVWFCSLLSVLSAVGVFDVIFALHDDGGPNDATMVANLYTYRRAFYYFEFGYSAAVGLLVSVVLTALSILVFVYGRKGGMGYYNNS